VRFEGGGRVEGDDEGFAFYEKYYRMRSARFKLQVLCCRYYIELTCQRGKKGSVWTRVSDNGDPFSFPNPMKGTCPRILRMNYIASINLGFSHRL